MFLSLIHLKILLRLAFEYLFLKLCSTFSLTQISMEMCINIYDTHIYLIYMIWCIVSCFVWNQFSTLNPKIFMLEHSSHRNSASGTVGHGCHCWESEASALAVAVPSPTAPPRPPGPRSQHSCDTSAVYQCGECGISVLFNCSPNLLTSENMWIFLISLTICQLFLKQYYKRFNNPWFTWISLFLKL